MANEVTIKLTLTHEEWCEVVSAVETKAVLINEGRYDPEENRGDNVKWMATLASAEIKIKGALNENGVMY